MDTTTLVLAIVGSGLLSTLITLAIGWMKDIWEGKRQEKKRLFKIKEDAYREVVKNIDFVYQGIDLNSEEILKKKDNFLQNYRLMFLYCEDDIIKEINDVLDALVSSWPEDNEEMKEKKNRIARSMIVLRKQVVKDTTLTEKDFKHVA